MAVPTHRSRANLVAQARLDAGERRLMSGLFKVLQRHIDDNARRAVEVYAAELPDFRAVAADGAVHDEMIDFAVLLRRREVELGAVDQPFTAGDLAVLRAFGEARGAAGVSLKSQQRVLALHSMLTLREIHEAAGADDSADLMHMLAWLPSNGMAAQNAYTEGFLASQKRLISVASRVQAFTRMLLAGNPAAATAATGLSFSVAANYFVVVVRVPSPPFDLADDLREKIVDLILKRYRIPITWHEPEELIALLPADDADVPAEERALPLVRDFASMVGRPCSTGAARGRRQAMTDILTVARQVSRVAPVEAVPRRVHVMSDVFVELGVARTPGVEEWLRGIGQRLSAGPDLVTTLDVFYQHGMNRLRTADALHVHPRTLDYRLRRAYELTGLDPGSVRGVRTLSAVVALVLAGTWR
jgi:PucR-like helix-turn-helix protein